MNTTITHNLTTLLRAGAFEDTSEAHLLAMSPHKWRVLIKASDELKVQPYIARGAQMIKQGVTPLPEEHEPLSTDTLPDELLTLNDEVPEYETDSSKLFNIFTNNNLNSVREEEKYSRGKTRKTLTLLNHIVAVAESIITKDVSIEGIISLGTYIRANSNYIDYDLLCSWLIRIGLVQLASLEGSMLITCMGFTQEELPFVKRTKKKSKELFLNPIEKVFEPHSFSTASRMDVAFVETVSHLFSSAISSVTDVQE